MTTDNNSGTIRATGGFPIPRMQRLSGTDGDGQRGAQIPSMPPVSNPGGDASTQDSGLGGSGTDSSGGGETSGDS